MPIRRNIFGRISRLSYANLSLLFMRALKDCGAQQVDIDRFIEALERYAIELHKDLSEDERKYFLEKKLEAVKKPRKPKTPTKTLRLIRKGLLPEILKLRQQQHATWDEIAKYLSKHHRIRVSRETLRQLCNKVAFPTEEANEHGDSVL